MEFKRKSIFKRQLFCPIKEIELSESGINIVTKKSEFIRWSDIKRIYIKRVHDSIERYGNVFKDLVIESYYKTYHLPIDATREHLENTSELIRELNRLYSIENFD